MIMLPSVKLLPLITASFKGGGLPQSTLAQMGGGDAHSPDDSHFSSMAPCNLYTHTHKKKESQYILWHLDCIRTNHTIWKCFPVYTRGRQPNAHMPTLAQWWTRNIKNAISWQKRLLSPVLHGSCYTFYKVSDENVSDFTCILLCRCRLAWSGTLSRWGYTQHNPPLEAHHR